MIDVDLFRQKLRIAAEGAINIELGPDVYRGLGNLTAMFHCLACDRHLIRTKKHNLYECPECGIELTAQEAIDLCDKYRKLINELSKDSGGKMPFWKRIFR